MKYVCSLREFISPPKLLAAICVLVLASSLASPARAQTCADDTTGQFLACRSPASGVPFTLWGELKPVDEGVLPASRDNTDFYEFTDWDDENEPHWMSMDVEDGWIFAAITKGFQVWDASSPDNPSRVAVVGRSKFPHFVTDPHESDPVRDIDAPPGNADIVAVAQVGDGGLAIFDTTSKSNPLARYGDRYKTTAQVYAGHVGGRDYAFSANKAQGVFAYDMTSAAGLGSTCLEETPGQTGCGVYEGQIGMRDAASYIDGVSNAAESKMWVAFSSGDSRFGMEIWDVSNPSDPQFRISDLSGSFVYGVALWRNGSQYFLGMRIDTSIPTQPATTQLRVYDVSCLANNSCGGSLGTRLDKINLPPHGGGEYFVTYSQGNGRDFLYLGNANRYNSGTQNEWLVDVTNPSNIFDITPPDKSLDGALTGYWGWYYRNNPTGFNFVNPRVGKFNGAYFYRVAYTLFDIHELTTGGPPTVGFSYAPGQVYRGQEIDFTDLSTGVPTTWDWSFQNASPSTSVQQSPQGVVFDTTGAQQVTLTATNVNGSDSETQSVMVLSPEPVLGSISAYPSPALVCQPVTFTALGVTGLPPLSYSWEILDGSGTVVDTGGNVNPFVWNTTGFDPADGPFRARVSVLNGLLDPLVDVSSNVTLQGLTALAFTSPGGAPETLNGPPFSDGAVQLSIQTEGATEWRWNFGDGAQPVWVTDPATGPNPTHTYQADGSYDAYVSIRNCQPGTITSAFRNVVITNSSPLVADFEVGGIFCFNGQCFANKDQALSFFDNTVGSPDFWDYDWNGDGTFEDSGHVSPVNSHSYSTDATVQPRLRVRRGAGESIYELENILIIGDGGSVAVDVSGPGTGFALQQLVYTAAAQSCIPQPTTWSWNPGAGGTILGSSSGSMVTVVYSSGGSKSVQATAGNGDCAGTVGSTSPVITDDPNYLFVGSFEAGDGGEWAVVVNP